MFRANIMNGRDIPHLKALRAFESAARHGSLGQAAEELCVTPSAVGHQVRNLESFLGVRLFDRTNHHLRLTSAGQRFSSQLREGFDVISKAVRDVRRQQADHVLTISATPALALRWLAPKLDHFRKDYPGVEFRIDASSSEADLAAGEVDIDIRYGINIDERLHADVLFQEAVFPVANPAYLTAHQIASPSGIVRATRLQVDDWGSRGGIWRCWEAWAALAGITEFDPLEGPRYSQMNTAVEAAARGDGIAFGATRHMRSAELQNKLVQPFDPALELPYSAFMVTLPEVAEQRHIRLFRNWILRNIENDDPKIIHQGAF